MSKDLLYKPSLDYDKSYYTEGDIFDNYINNESTDNNSDNGIITDIDKIKDLIDEIKSKFPMLPPYILDAFAPPFIGVIDMIDKMEDEAIKNPIKPTKPETPEFIPIDPDKPRDPEIVTDPDFIPDDPFGREEDVYVDIKLPDISEKDELEKEYQGDLLDVFNDYLYNFNSAIDGYVHNTLIASSHSESSTIKQITTKNLKDKKLSHVSDFLTKSSIILGEQVSLYTKMFDTNETCLHLMSTKVANEQRKRYVENNKLDDVNIITKVGNSLLTESLKISQKKYEENFYSLYKYLNSSVILFSECINTSLRQNQALILLNNKEGEH